MGKEKLDMVIKSANKEKTYIHYGSSHFDISKFDKITNVDKFTKPDGGLWGSPSDSKYSWKDFCLESSIDRDLDNFFEFKLKEDSKVFHIYSIDDLKDLPGEYLGSRFYIIDFEKIVQENLYDAIELHLSNEKISDLIFDTLQFTYRLNWQLCAWDCDSILILNPNIIIPI